MNSGLAVVLGALIALTGSALIPWLRESLTQRRVRAETRRQRRDDALIDFLTKNSNLGFMNAAATDDMDTIRAFEERERAANRLLLEIDDGDERVSLARTLTEAIPSPIDTEHDTAEDLGRRVGLLSELLIRWSTGTVSVADLDTEWRRRSSYIGRSGRGEEG